MTAYFEAAGVAKARVAALLPELDDAFRTTTVWSRPVAGTAAALGALPATGVRLAIVSNADGRVEELLRTLGICVVGPGPLVEIAAVVDSTVVGVEKPDPRIFGIALEVLGVPSERTLHVGDSQRADAAGARAAGILPVDLDPLGTCDDGTHRHVAGLEELVPLVKAASGLSAGSRRAQPAGSARITASS